MNRAGSKSAPGRGPRACFGEHSKVATTERREQVRAAVVDNALDFAQWLFPEGHREGQLWRTGDFSGAPGKSLAVTLSGPFAGSCRDWSTGEQADCFGAVERHFGYTFPQALEALSARYGIVQRPCLPMHSASRQNVEEAAKKVREWPAFEKGSKGDWERLSELRAVSLVAVRSAVDVGLIRFATLKGHRAWIVTDGTAQNAQARRLDGKAWSFGPSKETKTYTLPGSRASWPLGVVEGKYYPKVLLLEGGGDLLAALHFIHASGDLVTWFPVALLGASHRIPSEALMTFAGRHVRIFPHADEAGRKALYRWTEQLRSVDCTVDAFCFDGLLRQDGAGVNDLNDATQIHPDDVQQLSEVLP